jgi:Arc/MetJ-type ribon-helix-helix transcriptional regulator
MEAVAIPAKFTKMDIQLLDHFVKEGYFSTRSDLIRTSVRHYLHELTMMEIEKKIKPKTYSKDGVKKEIEEIRKVRRAIWKNNNA